MELRHLRYFIALAEELHFARAAQRLNIAPPTLTVQIQEIERTLAARLFARTRRSVALTPAGEVFLVEARAVLERFARAESTGRRAGRGEIGRIALGYVGSAAYAGVLQDQTRRFRAGFPAVEITAREWPMDALPGLVAEGQVDIGFVRLPMALPRGLRTHALLRDYFCLAHPAGHPADDVAAGEGAVAPEALAGEAFIMPEQGAGTYEVARRGGFTPRIVSAPGNLLAVLTQVSLGMGVAVVPGVVRQVVGLPNVAFARLAGATIGSEVAALFRASESGPMARNFIRQVVETPEAMRAFTPGEAGSMLAGGAADPR